MDVHDLFLSCRKGDLERIRHLIEERDVELNVRDKWDSTPLYYACLCGHVAVVQYLLEHGAKCEANTFDGERCLYGALSDDIRNLLRSWKAVTTQIIRRNAYEEFLRKLLDCGDFSDITFVVHGFEFCAHKCVLSARSEYFFEMLTEKWHDKSTVHLTNSLINPYAFQAVLQYLYTGKLEIPLTYKDDVLRLAHQCKLENLVDALTKAVRKTEFLQHSKPGTHINTLIVEPPLDDVQLRQDFGILVQEAMPLEFCTWIGSSELPFYPEEKAPFADVIVEVEGSRFHCHKAFICGRSEYFRTLMRDPLSEYAQSTSSVESSCSLPTFKLTNVTSAVFIDVLSYIYQDAAKFDVANVNEVLLAADLFLLPGLKRQCGAYIAPFLDNENIISVLRMSRLFELHRLEDQCFEFIAKNIEQVIENAEFHKVVQEDASGLAQREETDSIDVIDNIRFHLTASSLEEAQEKLSLIDDLLKRLDLDA